MQFGLYAPIPMATVGSPEVAQAVTEALRRLPAGASMPSSTSASTLLLAADKAGFELALFAERHSGNDLSAWVMASAVGSPAQSYPRARRRSSRPMGSGAWSASLQSRLIASAAAAWR